MRLTSVCEITQNASPNTCGQTGGNQNGYVTTYTYGVNASSYPYMKVTQGPAGSQQTRTYTYDLLGRLISEQNPENGTTSYTYDSVSSGTCVGTYSGDLVKLTDARGNVICYTYDAIHRKTQITYPSGPDAANTPSKTFVYDSATFNNQAMTNPKGRLVEAYTGPAGSKATDEFFQYSVRGELTDAWECTPHSGTNGCASVSNYYKVTAGFWENGGLKSLSSNISGLPTQTYSVDPMGRTSAVQASSGQQPVTATSYNLSTSTYGVTFGSGDSDTFLLDQYTGRQTQYQFTVNGATNTGVTTWNPNGSLKSLNISDNIAGTADTQNCSYTHDDLARVSSVACVNGSTNIWNQQFTYDAFGNIAKNSSGPGGIFQPTYSSSTNWITALPGCTPTTDNNGQMTNDCAHNYTWDSEGKLHSVDSTTLTHDALGRMVEKTVGSTYTQFVYGPAGNTFAIMNGQTLVKAFIPLPAAVAVYGSSGLAYYRHADHLGSSRLSTTPSRSMYSSTAYSPHGEPYAQSGSPDVSFTGQNANTVPVTSNNITPVMYDFLARKYSPGQGRWLSPDPAGLGAADPNSPQTWNRYAYVVNSPMNLIDPLGLDCVYVYDDGSTWTVAGDCYSENDNGYYVDGSTGCTGWNCGNVDWNADSGHLSIAYSNNGVYTVWTATEAAATSGYSALPDSGGVINSVSIGVSISIGPHNGNAVLTQLDPNWARNYCSNQSDLAALDSLLPGLGPALSSDFKDYTQLGMSIMDEALKSGAEEAAKKAVGTTTVLLWLRSKLGVPMSVASKVKTGIGVAGALYNGYKAVTAAQKQYAACMAAWGSAQPTVGVGN